MIPTKLLHPNLTEEECQLLEKPLPLTQEEYRQVDKILKKLEKDRVYEPVSNQAQFVDSEGKPFKYEIEYFHKDKKEYKMWWADVKDSIGTRAFTFDKKKIYFMFGEYPYKLSKEEKEIFDKENPYWANFLKDY